MIAVIDYGVANLGSMLNMLRRVGAPAERVSTPGEIKRASKIILPGIGAFDQGMRALAERGLAEAICKHVIEDKVPLLGVCLGMQLLGEESEEGTLAGLGLIKARCKRLVADVKAGVRVPHMGWSHVRPLRQSRLLEGIDASSRYYFVHSYHVVCTEPADVLATASYGIDFCAMIEHANICGAQFHPEKSHRFGLRLLQNFAGL